MIIGRSLAGIGIGVVSAIVPLYISEWTDFSYRALGSYCVASSLVTCLLLHRWRTMFGIAVIPSILLALGMSICPESPRWLYQQGKIAEAEKAIKTLYGKEIVRSVMQDFTTASQGSSEPEAGWFEHFSNIFAVAVVTVGATLFLFQQLAGINAVVYYSTSIFRSAGIASDVAASGLVGASNVFGTVVASSLMDKNCFLKTRMTNKLEWDKIWYDDFKSNDLSDGHGRGTESAVDALSGGFGGGRGSAGGGDKNIFGDKCRSGGFGGGGDASSRYDTSKGGFGTGVSTNVLRSGGSGEKISSGSFLGGDGGNCTIIERKSGCLGGGAGGEGAGSCKNPFFSLSNSRDGRNNMLMLLEFLELLSVSFSWKVLAPYSGTLAVLATVLYVLSFSLGAGPVPALLLPEIFASRIRAKAISLSLGTHLESKITCYYVSLL
ncbi:unnamed protein product [Trifolium pratense]|uniref:Uncharacterized protein n=1 Tax=Trifolium pratense TaxID=57577 RepID=A0ACB0K2I4_TRIPR|nr:unnamed protein product [Trifolium pratense]